MEKTFEMGEKLRIRRSPSAPVQEARVDAILLKLDNDTLGAWVMLSIRGSGRLDEHESVGVFLLSRWVEMAEEVSQ